LSGGAGHQGGGGSEERMLLSVAATYRYGHRADIRDLHHHPCPITERQSTEFPIRPGGGDPYRSGRRNSCETGFRSLCFCLECGPWSARGVTQDVTGSAGCTRRTRTECPAGSGTSGSEPRPTGAWPKRRERCLILILHNREATPLHRIDS